MMKVLILLRKEPSKAISCFQSKMTIETHRREKGSEYKNLQLKMKKISDQEFCLNSLYTLEQKPELTRSLLKSLDKTGNPDDFTGET